MGTITELRVNRRDLAKTEIAERPQPELQDGEVLLEVTRYGLTANNVTYGITGERIGYWTFFPTPDAPEDGIIPVWGYGTVTESRSDQMQVGEEVYGYFPMATHVVMKPKRRGANIIDAAPHRAQLPLTYNAYQLTAEEPAMLRERKDARAVLFPLFATSYIIADWLEDNQFFGAEQVVVTSASSKTSFGTGAALGRIAPDKKRIGLTSAGRKEFVRSLKAFDEVFSYEEFAQIDPSVPTAFVDMSGNAEVIGAVHNHVGENIKTSAIVGVTHWEAPRQKAQLPGAKPTMFFAPGQIQKRDAEKGPGVVMREALTMWAEVSDGLGDLLTYEHHEGPGAAEKVWQDTLAGKVDPSRGITVSLA